MNNYLERYKELAELFAKNGFNLYLVGGTVRDFLLRKELTDMDAVTDATPDEIKPFLEAYKPDFTFAKFGSVKLKINDVKFDITTLRKERGYFDSRHPGKIEFVKSLDIDVIRRDFTVNAMYLDKTFRIIDFVGGEKDLNDGVLRMVGNPEKRLKEDPLRIIRAIRFCLTHNLIMDEALKKAILNDISLLDKLNKDKIIQDIRKIECNDKERIEKIFNEFGIIHYLNMVN